MSKFLVIAEKPSVAQSYAKNLSAYKREDGYLEGESCIVSWCLGHLAEYAQPEEYDPKYEKWQFDDLPILPEAWKLKVSKDKKKQFEVIKTLMNRSDVEYLVNGCDAGRERRRFQTAREVIGKCPVCGCDVFEGKQNFYCSNRQCDFALWKENRFLGSMEKNLDKKMARELLDKACTHVKGLYSKKKDMKFDADLLLTLEDGKPRFHLEFPKKKKK